MELKSPSINLLKKEEGRIDRFIDWSLTIGRIVVILTEAIAFSAFIYRFSLDRQLIDLNQQIKQKQQVLLTFKTSEGTYRNLQTRLSDIAQLNNQASQLSKVLYDIVALAPSDFIITSFALSQTGITLQASTPSTDSLSQFINGLKTYSKINAVSVDKIENKTTSSLLFVSISASFKR